MKKVAYFVEYWHTEPGSISPPEPFYQTFGVYTSKAAAIKDASAMTPDRRARVRKHTHTLEVIWRSKTLRGDTRARKAR